MFKVKSGHWTGFAMLLLLSLLVCAIPNMLVGASTYVGVIGDDYPSKYKKAAMDSMVDEWRYYNRECVSFVAWRLNSRNGIAFHNYYRGVHWGNGCTWKAAAQSLGIRVDQTPAKGAIYWKNTHVAWVSGVSGNKVTIEEYNYDYAGNYRYRNVYKGASGVYYIHVKDLTSSSSSASSSSSSKYINIRKGTVGNLDAKYRYTGKAIVPAVNLKYGGKTLAKGSAYTVTCKSNRSIGTATMYLKGRKSKGYTGTVKKTFKVVPKGTSVKQLRAMKGRKITVGWRTQKIQTNGYQLQFSRFPTMALSKKMTLTSNARNSCVLKAAFPNSKYYVRIRTYKLVGGKKIYSKWCRKKTVKTIN